MWTKNCLREQIHKLFPHQGHTSLSIWLHCVLLSNSFCIPHSFLPESSRQTYFCFAANMRTCAFWCVNFATSSFEFEKVFFRLKYGPFSVRISKWKTGLYSARWEMETTIWVVDAFMASVTVVIDAFHIHDMIKIKFWIIQWSRKYLQLMETIYGIRGDCDDSIISHDMIHVSTASYCRSNCWQRMIRKSYEQLMNANYEAAYG